MDENSIRKFKCENCLNNNNYLRKISIKKNIGFICERCWKKYNKIINYYICI